MSKKSFELDIKSIRIASGLNQTVFWETIGVTQSGGSRYERGRSIPKPVQELLRLVYVEKIDLSEISSDDILVAKHLKQNEPLKYNAIISSLKARDV